MPKLDKKWRLGGILSVIIAVVILAVIFGGSAKPAKTAQNCGNYRDDRNITINNHTFRAEAPDNEAAFEKGLGGRPCILPDEAMIFPFTAAGQYPFWMKDMKFPIDILWINPSHEIVAEKVNLQPSSYPNKYANPTSLPAQYVLEIRANRTKELNITPGTIAQF